MVAVVFLREGRWAGPLCGEEEVFHYGCRLHYLRENLTQILSSASNPQVNPPPPWSI
jgi:hypothetical protein